MLQLIKMISQYFRILIAGNPFGSNANQNIHKCINLLMNDDIMLSTCINVNNIQTIVQVRRMEVYKANKRC